jgi:hypothetical protein
VREKAEARHGRERRREMEIPVIRICDEGIYASFEEQYGVWGDVYATAGPSKRRGVPKEVTFCKFLMWSGRTQKQMWSAASFQTFWDLIEADLIEFCNAVIRGLVLGARLLYYGFDRGHPLDFRWSLKLRFGLILPQNATRSCSWSLLEECQVTALNSSGKMICSNSCNSGTQK